MNGHPSFLRNFKIDGTQRAQRVQRFPHETGHGCHASADGFEESEQTPAWRSLDSGKLQSLFIVVND